MLEGVFFRWKNFPLYLVLRTIGIFIKLQLRHFARVTWDNTHKRDDVALAVYI